MSWEYKNTVLIYTSKDFTYQPNIAGCGLSHTLIKRGAPFPDIWELWSPKILEKFKFIHEKGASIVFISNQYDQNISSVKAKFSKFMQKFVINDDNPIEGDRKPPVEIPVMAMFAMKKNCFKKPFTNLWKVLGFIYHMKKFPEIDPAKSIFIGGCDGGIYLKNWKEGASKKYFQKKYTFRSDVDRAFAKNIGVRFISNRSLFLDKPEPKWQWNSYILSVEERVNRIKKDNNVKEPDILEQLEKFPNVSKYLIIIMGLPSSGKTTLSKILVDKLYEKHGLEYPVCVISDKVKMSVKKFNKLITDSIFEKTTIIVTKYSCYKKRNDYITLVRKYEVPTLIIHLKTDKKICQILNHTKVQISRDFDLEVYEKEYISWKKYFEAPDYVENDIIVMEYPLVLKFRKELKFYYS